MPHGSYKRFLEPGEAEVPRSSRRRVELQSVPPNRTADDSTSSSNIQNEENVEEIFVNNSGSNSDSNGDPNETPVNVSRDNSPLGESAKKSYSNSSVSNDDSSTDSSPSDDSDVENLVENDLNNDSNINQDFISDTESVQSFGSFTEENENFLSDDDQNAEERLANENVSINRDEQQTALNELYPDNAAFVQELRKPLFEGCPVTQEESELLILSLVVRHHNTDINLEDLIKVIDCHLPHPVHTSKYLFLRRLKETLTEIETHYYCSTCFELLIDAKCPSCHVIYNLTDSKIKGNFFLKLPIESQLKDLLNRHYLSLRRESDSENDVINGSVYKKLKRKGIIKENDITLQINSDGVQVFKSSTVSMTPIQVCVNELPYRLRKNNLILCGLWYGLTAPNINLFYEPIVEELQRLYREGFVYNTPDGNEITVKVHVVLCTVDAVERCKLQNMKQYNGKYGCSVCLHKGERIPVKHGYARVYRGEEGVMRTDRLYKTHLFQAIRRKKCIKGVIGASILSLIPNFSICSSMPPDYLHNVCLGIVKFFFCAWFDPKNDSYEWCLSKKVNDFDEQLLSIQPPREISRTPQSIKKRGSMKASEWRTILLYYSLPCLKDLLPEKYLKHWSLFVYAIYIFLKPKYTEAEFTAAESALRKFVIETETLYDPSFMTFNLHSALHIPLFVRRFGSLWSWSTFPFEHNNGILRNMFHNSQAVPQQICKSYLRLQYVDRRVHEIFEMKTNSSQRAYELVQDILKTCRMSKNSISMGRSLRLFGAPTIYELSVIQKGLAENIVRERVENVGTSYSRFSFNNNIFHGTEYTRLKKRNDSTILITNGSFLLISNIVIVKTILSQRKKVLVFGNKLNKCNDIICNWQHSRKFNFIVEMTNDIDCVFTEMISTKCTMVKVSEEKFYVTPLVNIQETD